MLSLYIMRHGQTPHSRENRFCGTSDPPLTEVGQAMAEALAEAYGSLPWQAIYTSTLARTKQTAAPLARRAGVTPQAVAALGEIAFGAWEGETQDEMARRHPEAFAHWSADPARRGTPGGETAFMVAARATPVVDDLIERHKDGNVLIVSHKATIRIIACSLLGLDIRLYRDRLNQPAGSLTVFDFGKRGAQMRVMADTSYMPAHLRASEGT